MSFELRHLRAFVAVAEELHFGHAAERLFVAQPAVSQTIKQMELQLGLALFERNSRSVSLTPEGLELFPVARELVADADDLLGTVAVLRRRSVGRIRVGLAIGGAGPLNGPIFEAFRATHPMVEIEAVAIEMADQIAALLTGRCDVLLHYSPVAHERLEAVALFCEPRIAIVSTTHPLADAEALDVADLLDQPFRAFADKEPADLRDFATFAEARGGPARYVGSNENGTVLDALPNIARYGTVDTTRASGAALLAPLSASLRSIPIRDAEPATTIISWVPEGTDEIVEAFTRTAQLVSTKLIGLIPDGVACQSAQDLPA